MNVELKSTPSIETLTPPDKNQIANEIGAIIKKIVNAFVLPCYKDKSNQHAEDAQKSSLAWIDRFKIITDEKLFAKIAASGFGIFMGKAHPRANLEKLSLVSDFVTWLFIYDDMIERLKDENEIKHLHKRTLKILKGGALKETDIELTKGFHEIVNRIDKTVNNKIWKDRFIKDIEDYCDATLWEYHNRADKRIPTLDAYKYMRPFTSGTYIMFDFIELIEDFCIPEDVFNSDFFQQARLMAANLVNWKNDLLSAQKEFLSDDVHNLVFVLKQELNCSFEVAFEKARDLFLEDLKTFLTYLNKANEQGENVRNYIKCMKEWVSAHWFWAKTSLRYKVYFS